MKKALHKDYTFSLECVTSIVRSIYRAGEGDEREDVGSRKNVMVAARIQKDSGVTECTGCFKCG